MNKTVLVLLGPTASGKSALAMALAERRAVEIISVDSALVYRGMDIGTAKPSDAERARVVHHLIDISSPWVPYSAADFVRDANRAIEQVCQRGRLPLLCGGTMLYYLALRDGLSQIPQVDATWQAELRARHAREGHEVLLRELHQIDAETAARLLPNDRQRLLRALGVYYQSGRSLSDWHRLAPPQPSPWRFRAWALWPPSRPWLHERIAQRFTAMLEAGLLDEVRGLMAEPGFSADLPSMRSVGYRQAIEHLQGRSSRTELSERGCAATRQLAKRQLTWLRTTSQLQALDASCVQDNLTTLLKEIP